MNYVELQKHKNESEKADKAANDLLIKLAGSDLSSEDAVKAAYVLGALRSSCIDGNDFVKLASVLAERLGGPA